MKLMQAKRQIWSLSAVVGLLLLGGQGAWGQTPDFNTFKGDNNRTGYTSAAASPGVANLRWAFPDNNPAVNPIVVDNTDSAAVFNGAWVIPPVDQEANNVHISSPLTPPWNALTPYALGSIVLGSDSGLYKSLQNGNIGHNPVPPDNVWWATLGTEDGYRYAVAQSSTATVLLPPSIETTGVNLLDPRVSQATGVLSTVVATYTLTPADSIPRYYTVNTWIPQGPTGNALSGFQYQQNHFVYEVDYDNGSTFVDVFDITVAGTGFVPLGNGGLPTNKKFHYDGIHPIVVKVYDTNPRDASGNLFDTAGKVVYADAFEIAPSLGSISATPNVYQWGGGAGQARVVSASNVYNTTVVNGQPLVAPQGVVRSFDINQIPGAIGPLWQWVLGGQDSGTVLDNLSAGVTANVPFASDTASANKYSVDYFSAPITNTLLSSTFVSYGPTIPDGDYDIYIWVAGDGSGENFGHQVQVEIDEGPTVTLTTIDESTGGGRFYKVGTRKFTHAASVGNDLTVKISNYSALATDAGLLSYADAVAFVGRKNLGTIISTPVQDTVTLNMPGGATASVPVTIVCGEDGRIYCLDAVGNANGTTNVYWTYPTLLPDDFPAWDNTVTYNAGDIVSGTGSVNYRSLQAGNVGNVPGSSPTWWGPADPNQVSSEDGVGPTAEMPTGFDVSSALIVKGVGGGPKDYLYIGAKNGRVYCIDMAGRGDMNLASKVSGTTTRVWTYPDDFPGTAKVSNLGPFKGSLAFDNVGGSTPTIFAPTSQGRMFALNALPTNVANKTTSVFWTYPALASPALGQITTTPAVDNADQKIFFGTAMSNDGSKPGALIGLNEATGTVAFGPATQFVDATVTNPVKFDNFVGGPAFVPSSEFGGATPANTIFVSNQNRYVLAYDASSTGANPTPLWYTNELGTTVTGALTFSDMVVFDNSGTPITAPIILVPTDDGRIEGLFADPATVNVTGKRRAYEKFVNGGLTASIAVGRNWMYAGDSSGLLYAYNNGVGFIGSGPPPGGDGIVENNPLSATFNTAKIKFITQAAYQQLRLNPTGLTFADVNGTAYDQPGPPFAFEWGQTIYVLAYNFQYLTNGGTVPAPVVNYNLSVEGQTLRQLSQETRLLSGETPASSHGAFALLSFTIQGSGANALPPGNGQVTMTVTSSAVSGTGSPQTFSVDPVLGHQTFTIANPLALIMRSTNEKALDPSGNPLAPGIFDYQIGAQWTTDHTKIAPANDDANLVNGSPDVYNLDPTNHSNLLYSTTPPVSHGQTGSAEVAVIDRSLMTLLRGANVGLNNVRVSRQDLAWNKGAFAGTPATPVGKPLPSYLTTAASVNFPTGFNAEDYPINFPNDSLDYPDIPRRTINVTKDPNGNAENPLFNGVSLNAPTFPGSDVQILSSTPLVRGLVNTPFVFDVNVPQFQPWNLGATTPDIDSAGNSLQNGYTGAMVLFVDNSGTGVFDITAPHRPAFRSFNLATGVTKDERFHVDTPVVDLGSLPVGAGYSPLTPSDPLSPFSPFTGPFTSMFQPFVLKNDGNVNLTDVRLAHGYQEGANPVEPWQIAAPANDTLGWLDGTFNMWSDLDNKYFLPTIGGSQIALQKPRVGDRSSTELSINPIRRANPSHGAATGGRNFPLITPSASVPPPGPPHITATVPLGFPSGTYSSLVRVIEDSNESGFLDLNTPSRVPAESYSDPSFILKFTVKESQLTNNYTSPASTMVDPYVVPTPPGFLFKNVQPTAIRDTHGNLLLAWASDRGPFTIAAQPTGAVTDSSLRIYVSSVQGANPAAALGGTSPLNDLNAFTPDPTNSPSTQWFQQGPGPFPDPALITSYFTAGTGPLQEVQFHYPSMPSSGFVNPLVDGGTFGNVTMAFVGDAQIPTDNGRLQESRLFATSLVPDATGHLPASPLPSVFEMPFDINSAKGRPSVVQLADNNSVIFYPAAGTGESVLKWVTFTDAGFTEQPHTVNIPNGFESVGAPSAIARTYKGASALNGQTIIDLSFTGKIRGRANSEVFLSRLALNGGEWELTDLPARDSEVLSKESESGLYRAAGVAWDSATTLVLNYTLGATTTSLLNTSMTTDPETGLIRCDTALGRVYLDPNLGTVRFATAPPNPNATLTLSYQPKIIRISTSTAAGYAMPSLVFDNGYASNIDFWSNAGAAATDSDPLRNARYLVTYGRASVGAGQAARPLMTTMRLGVQLPTPIATDAGGNIIGAFSVTGASAPVFYQVDPVQGKVYFLVEDEDKQVNITYTPVDAAGNVGVSTSVGPYNISLITEKPEAPLPIEGAINESNVTTFMDPFDGLGFATKPGLRPNLMWMFWSSSRNGGSDLFFQTLAPRLTPVVGGK